MQFSLLAKEIVKLAEEDSENSIKDIMHSISWNDTIYRTFNEGIRLSWQFGYQKQLPASLIEYIHNAHISFIVMSLRKLYERKQPDKKSVNSIPTLYHKIAESADLFTRENYVCRDGYTYSEIPNDNEKNWRSNYTISYRHNRFDGLCGTIDSCNRSRDNKIPVEIFEKLKEGNVLSPKIGTFANKFLAHASSANNRPNETAVFQSVTLRAIENQIKRAIWGIQQMGKLVDHLILTTVATPQFDPIENWCGTIFNSKIESKLSAYWYKRMDWWQKWFDHYWMTNDLYISPCKKYIKKGQA